MRETDTGRDQISLRELLWESELRIATLPEEYNLLLIQGVRHWTTDVRRAAHHPQPAVPPQFDRYARATDPAGQRIGLVAASKLPTAPRRRPRAWRGMRGAEPREPTRRDRLDRLGRLLADLPATLAGRLRRG